MPTFFYCRYSALPPFSIILFRAFGLKGLSLALTPPPFRILNVVDGCSPHRQSFVEMQKVPVTSDVLDGSMGADLDDSIKGGRASRQQQQLLHGRRPTLDI